MLFKLGAIGLIVFLIFIISFIIRSINGIKVLKIGVCKTYYIGYLLFVISIVPHSIVSPRIMEGKYITIIALSIGMLELIRRYLALNVDENKLEQKEKLLAVENMEEKYPSVTLKTYVNK